MLEECFRLHLVNRELVVDDATFNKRLRDEGLIGVRKLHRMVQVTVSNDGLLCKGSGREVALGLGDVVHSLQWVA